MTGRLEGALLRASDAQLAELFDGWSAAEAGRALSSWGVKARRSQLPPPGDWRTWLILAGRGFGKTRAGAEWVRRLAMSRRSVRIAIVGATHHDARSVMVEGESGLLNVGPPAQRPTYEPSNRLLRWPSGTVGQIFSAEEPDSLRGPAFHAAWGDEIARWEDGAAVWMNLQMALRQGKRPRTVLTTTPKPVALLRQLLADAPSGRVAVTRGRTADNAANLAPSFIEAVTAMYGGTLLGRQELDGELVEDVEGALWTRATIERCRAAPGAGRPFGRIVVGVDPPATAGDRSDACGIVVAALGADGRAYVLADMSDRPREPNGWAEAVVRAYHAFEADRVVAEANNGGDMVTSVLRAVDAGLPVKLVRASRGKAARAEPVAALYTAGRVSHAGAFPELEDEMGGLTMGGAYHGPGRSPDRADALVWALTELMLGRTRAPPRVWVG